MRVIRPRRGAGSVVLGLAGAALLVTGVACTPQSRPAPPPPSTEHRGPAGPVPAGLAAYYGQSLYWSDCAPYATTSDARQSFGSPDFQCARLRVPLDYAKPDGTQITLGLLRRKATGKRIGSLVINPGGPGVSGMEAAASLAPQVSGSDLGKRFDLVGFDPRGIGASQPRIDCYTDQERDAERAADLDADTSPSGVAKDEAEQRDYAAKCAARTQYGDAMLANMGTRDVARDMDVLRSALGDTLLTYVGFSYGTRIGAAYAAEFPHNVRAMVLDGAVDPNQDAADAVVAQGQGFQEAFNQFATWCAALKDCALGSDPARADDNFRNLVNPLADRKIRLSDGRELTYDDATTGVIQALYSQQYWPVLNQALNGLRQGNGRILMVLADAYEERSADGHYSTTQDANTAVRCVDDPSIKDRGKLAAAEQRYKQVAPFLDNGKPAAGELDACAFWPVPNTSQSHLPKVTGLPPTLTISTTRDPATPYQAGVNLANALGGGLLTFDGTQHTAFLQNNACVDRAGVDYLVNLRLPPAGTRCG